MNNECGLCGEKDFKKLVGPFAGGPFPYYCKRCHLIIDDYHDSAVVPRRPDKRELLFKWIRARDAHEQMIKELIQRVKVEKGMALCFTQKHTEETTK